MKPNRIIILIYFVLIDWTLVFTVIHKIKSSSYWDSKWVCNLTLCNYKCFSKTFYLIKKVSSKCKIQVKLKTNTYTILPLTQMKFCFISGSIFCLLLVHSIFKKKIFFGGGGECLQWLFNACKPKSIFKHIITV